MPRSILCFRTFLIFALFWAVACSSGCAAQGPFVTHATIDWPGATPRQMDDVVARPVGRRMFRASGGVREVVSVSSAGKVDLYATSDGIEKQPAFVQAMSESLADSAGMLPRGAVAGPIELLPKGKAMPQPQVREVEELRIDIDRAKLIDAGLSYDDVSTAIAKAREEEASHSPADVATTAPTARHVIEALNATTLPSRDKPVTLGDVAVIHVAAAPDTILRHWP